MTTDRMLTLREVAERLGIGRSAAYELARTRQIRAYEIRPSGRRAVIRVPESAVDEYLESVQIRCKARRAR